MNASDREGFMAMCHDELNLQAFYDGQLGAAEAQAMREHLAQCAACDRKLSELSAMSNIFAGVHRPIFLPIAGMRLHRAIDDAMDGGLLKFAWSLSGIAAAILVAGSLWMMHVKDVPTVAQTASVPAVVTPDPWTTVATTADADSLLNSDQASPIAQWYLADAGRQSDELP